MYAAVHRGNLPMVKWIHSNGFTESVDDEALNRSARRGNLNMVKWIYANRPERFTAQAVGDITLNGPLRVADWLHTNYPECVPATLDGGFIWYLREFEMLLFVYARYPQCFTPQFVKNMKKHLEVSMLLSELGWLDARFPETK
ncbi:hypothetical protein PF005_g21374 [Phytophthora fragariae]|uniref:Uncharacterized protein n=1 Tax=Phytophthora fragariae TaxID=53985 RepID=A0A6A3XGY9_9STRA|nr:hypothetical protein PF009_g22513 [Phytophthora fragariae]KAE8985644.1 hypothetical protein PF011_g20303 [Phytophthora fragariae]KAE9084233.1 hypothetical protein PF007_g21590 [Phytophthora fragariae]KAE9099894.1 hypothetical protein PF010_g15018 [Phytophthora fragariae]KAE9134690.1 hypothetical protein PF006_g14763 [Phytophthora fragariae]